MARDALEVGPPDPVTGLPTYPNLPRNPDGSLDSLRMPVRHRLQKGLDGKIILLDVAPGQVHDALAAGTVTLPEPEPPPP